VEALKRLGATGPPRLALLGGSGVASLWRPRRFWSAVRALPCSLHCRGGGERGLTGDMGSFRHVARV